MTEVYLLMLLFLLVVSRYWTDSCFGHGRRHVSVRRGRTVFRSGFPRSQRQEALPDRQRSVGSLRDHHEIHWRIGS